MKSKSLDAQYSWAEAINEAACLNAGPAPKPANGASDEPPRLTSLKRRGNEAIARDGGRFFISVAIAPKVSKLSTSGRNGSTEQSTTKRTMRWPA